MLRTGRPLAGTAVLAAAVLAVGGCGNSSGSGKAGSAGHPTTAAAPGGPGSAAARPAGSPAPSPTPPPPELPGGGRTVLPGHIVVAYYGIVGTSNILGQTNNPEADAAGVEQQAAAYHPFGRVQPAFELVTTVASASAGADGSYSSAVDFALVQRYLDAAHRHKLLLVLDFQPGRAEFLPQVKRYERFLNDPSVGVALDPEWKLTAQQLPNQTVGSSSAASINAVSSYLSALVTARRLPQKLFVVHEFRLTELPDRQNVAIRAGLATVLQMDGLGPVSVKTDSYRQVTANAAPFHVGFKVFLRRVDDPELLTPTQVMALHPRPEFISYQ